MKYGLLNNVIDLGAYILGKSSVPFIQYNQTGDWEKWLPKYENQTTRLGDETSGCTVWGAQNQIETFYSFLYKEEPNYSERFTYNLVPITPDKGADPQKTYETIRRFGLIDNGFLPMTDSIDEFMDTSKFPLYLKIGKQWLDRHDFRHEWVWEKRPENYIELLKDALKSSPIGVSVSAWNEVNGVFVSDQGSVNNHFCLLYKIDDEGYPWIFDSYDHTKKKLAKDHNIRRAKRIWLNKKTIKASQRHVSVLQSILNALTMKKTFLATCTEHLGVDVTPLDTVDDMVACVDTVSTLLRKVRPETPYMVSTIVMNKYLQENYMLVDVPQAEDIIISPTSGKRIGHVGVIMEDNTIASNNSFGINRGKFTKNYTLGTWEAYYKNKLKLPVYIYRYKNI